MTGIGMNLTEYSSAELSVLLNLVAVAQLEGSINNTFGDANYRSIRMGEILQQWQVKLTEAREIVRREENIQSN